MIATPKGDHNLNIKIWVDGVQQTTQTVSLASEAGVLGSFILGTSLLGGNELIDLPYGLGITGKRIQKEVYNENASEDFFVSHMVDDYKFLGRKPS